MRLLDAIQAHLRAARLRRELDRLRHKHDVLHNIQTRTFARCVAMRIERDEALAKCARLEAELETLKERSD